MSELSLEEQVHNCLRLRVLPVAERHSCWVPPAARPYDTVPMHHVVLPEDGLPRGSLQGKPTKPRGRPQAAPKRASMLVGSMTKQPGAPVRASTINEGMTQHQVRRPSLMPPGFPGGSHR